MSFTDKKKKEVIDSIAKKCGGIRSCGRCGGEHFSLLDDFYRFESQSDMQSISMGGPSIPAYGIACENCGHIVFHAVGVISPNDL